MNTTVARDHVGEEAVVCGQVIGAGCSQRDGGLITLATDDRRISFRFRIPLDDRGKFGPHPEEQHLQRIVCANGRIERRDSLYELVLRDPADVSVQPDSQGLPLFAPAVARSCDPGIVLPKATREVKPQYPATNDRVEGAVLMQAIVNTDGRVGDVRVIRGLRREFDEAAVAATRQWQFQSGTLNGKPVPVVVTMEMTFMARK